MKVITYMCENCFEPHVFNPSDSNDDDIYICPKCGEKMMYFGTEEIDPTTNKVVNRYNEENRNRNLYLLNHKLLAHFVNQPMLEKLEWERDHFQYWA